MTQDIAQPDLELLEPIPEVPDHLLAMFGSDPAQLDQVGGAVTVVAFDLGDHSVVSTLGLSRLPVAGEHTELIVETRPDQVGAGRVALQIAVERVAESGAGWTPGRVWYNDVPFLAGTLIQALVVVDGDPTSHLIRSAGGEVVAIVRRLLMLTAAEARSFSVDGPEPLWDLVRADPGALRDVTRPDLIDADTSANLPCYVSKRLRTERAGYVVVGEDGEVQAFVGDESAEYVDDPDNVEIWALGSLLEREPGLREFVAGAVPGQFADRDGERWVLGGSG